MSVRPVLLALLLTTGICLASLPGSTAERRPNILLILTDDQGWPELGIHGNREIETPNIDRLARDGVEMTRFYASPVCTPTRAALMTGRYAHRTGAIDTYLGRDTLAASEITLAQVLQGAGYRTGLVGKWHLGRYMRYHPNNRGFDRFFGFWQYGFINRYFDSPELWENRSPVITHGYVTDVLTDEAIRFVKETPGARSAQPFFLYLAYNAPHSPNQAPDSLVSKYLKKGLDLKDAQIYAMIDSLDDNIGRLLKEVDARDTLVVFMTDNGYLSSHYSAGLRGKKGTVFEGGVRVPFIARWPGKFPEGRKVPAPAQHVDLFPTLCEAAGAPLPTGRKLDGYSLLRLLRKGEGSSPRRYVYHQWCRVKPDPNRNWAISDGRYKLADGMLFDLEKDPGETTDLASREPSRVDELRKAFLDWFRDVTAGQTYARVPIEVGRDDENPVEIDLTWAEPRGRKVKPQYRNYNRDYVDDWTVAGDALEWNIEVVKEGRYEVELTYGCAPEDAGGAYRITAGGAKLEGATQPAGRAGVYLRRTAGTLELRAGPSTLSMQAVTIPGRSLMELHKLRLRRL